MKTPHIVPNTHGQGWSLSALKRRVLRSMGHCPQERCKCGRPISANKSACFACVQAAAASNNLTQKAA